MSKLRDGGVVDTKFEDQPLRDVLVQYMRFGGRNNAHASETTMISNCSKLRHFHVSQILFLTKPLQKVLCLTVFHVSYSA